MAAGHNFVLALANDGTVYACGDNSKRALGDGTTTNSYTTFVSTSSVMSTLLANEVILNVYAGRFNGLATTNFGRLLAWGDNTVCFFVRN